MFKTEQMISKQYKQGSEIKEELVKLDFPSSFQAPYDPRTCLGNLVTEKLKVMDSKKKPIWLEFQNGMLKEKTNETIK